MQKNFKLAWQNPSVKNSGTENDITYLDQSLIIEKILKNAVAIQNKVIVIKLPSSIINNKKLFTNFIRNIELLKITQVKFIIIHDYALLETNIQEFFGIDKKKCLSQISDDKSIDIAEMIISGRINKQIVSRLCESGVPAIGISGKDDNLIIAKKLKKKSADKLLTNDENFTAEPLIVNSEILAILEDNEVVTVISPIAKNESGKTVILDVDSTASMICSAVIADYFVVLSDQNHFNDDYIKLYDSFELTDWIRNNEAHTDSPVIKAINNVIYNVSSTVCIVNPNFPNGLLQSILS